MTRHNQRAKQYEQFGWRQHGFRRGLAIRVNTSPLIECSDRFRKEWFSTNLGRWGDISGHEFILSNYLIENKPYQNLGPWDKKPRKKLFKGTGLIKKLTRVKVYEHVLSLEKANLDRFGAHYENRWARRILILPGGEPSHETSLIKELFPDKHIIAFDLDERAVELARPLVDLAVNLDVGDLRFANAKQSPSCLTHDYTFANLDFCGLVTSEGVGQAFERAARMSGYVATWFSYGHEQDLERVITEAEWVGLGAEHLFSDIPETIRNRLLYMFSTLQLSGPSYTGRRGTVMHPLKVWMYRDQAMPMFCVLWGHNPLRVRDNEYGNGAQRAKIPYEKVTGVDFRELVLDHVAKHGSEKTANYYGIDRTKLAAWKAVQTRTGRLTIGTTNDLMGPDEVQ